MNKQTAEHVAKILLTVKAVSLNPTKPFRYASGILSPIYTDCRILMSFPKERTIIRDYLIESIRSIDQNVDIIAGTATAGIPHAAWIAQEMKLPMIYVRSKPKDHGKENLIEGIIKKGQHTVMIEDLISTGETSVSCCKALQATGATCDYIFAIFTYDMKKSQQIFYLNKVKMIPLTNFQTVVTVAKHLGKIQKNQQDTILNWATDPTGWGKKMGFE